MAFQSVHDTAEAVIQFTRDGKLMYNVLNFIHAGGYDLSNLQELADVVDVQVGADWLPLIASNTDYLNTLVRGLEFAADQEANASANAGSGAASGGGMPNNVTFVTTLRTGLTGRSQRGRMYWITPGVSALLTPNTVTALYSDATVDAVADLFAAALGFGWTPVVVSRFHLGAARSTAQTTEITTVEARNNLTDSQRGRLPTGH